VIVDPIEGHGVHPLKTLGQQSRDTTIKRLASYAARGFTISEGTRTRISYHIENRLASNIYINGQCFGYIVYRHHYIRLLADLLQLLNLLGVQRYATDPSQMFVAVHKKLVKGGEKASRLIVQFITGGAHAFGAGESLRPLRHTDLVATGIVISARMSHLGLLLAVENS